MPGPRVKSRRWVATLWLHMVETCLEETIERLVKEDRVRFVAYGAEVAPKTGALHYQAYIILWQPQALSFLISLFGTGHDFAVMRGSLKENEAYCSKEGTLRKVGEEPAQGCRTDLIGVKRLLDEQIEPMEIARKYDEHFPTCIKFHAGLDKYANYVFGKKIRTDRSMPKVYLRIGEAGSGKTSWLDEHYGLDEWASMPIPTSSWWITPTVSRANVVLVDDVGPKKVPKVEEFLQWTDRYPIEFNSKGGFLWWKPKVIVFTSNVTWDEWWPNLSENHRAAVERRIYKISLVFKGRPEEHFYPNGEDAGDVHSEQAHEAQEAVEASEESGIHSQEAPSTDSQDVSGSEASSHEEGRAQEQDPTRRQDRGVP